MARLNRITEYLEKSGYPKGKWSEFARFAGIPIWRLSRIILEVNPPTVVDLYKITDAFERIFTRRKIDPRDIFLP